MKINLVDNECHFVCRFQLGGIRPINVLNPLLQLSAQILQKVSNRLGLAGLYRLEGLEHHKRSE